MTAALALLLGGCGVPVPTEPVPDDWSLDVHQPGAWWTRPLIPRSVVVQRCPPPPGWSSEPNLNLVAALPPGGSVNYTSLADDYHCGYGWSEPESEVAFSAADVATEAGLRRACSSTGLPMDASWRYVGRTPARIAGGPTTSEPDLGPRTDLVAAFVDQQGTVVGCRVGLFGGDGDATVELSLGGDVPAAPVADCPVGPSDLVREDGGTVGEYRLRGAGVVRGADGRVLTGATSLRIGLAGDTVTTEHPVVEGIAVVDAWVKPGAAIPLDWDQPLPAVTGQVYGADGALLATCRR